MMLGLTSRENKLFPLQVMKVTVILSNTERTVLETGKYSSILRISRPEIDILSCPSVIYYSHSLSVQNVFIR